MKPIICADCKWHMPNPASKPTGLYSDNFDHCAASEEKQVNLVNGKTFLSYKYCEFMRLSGPCGIDGNLFELNQDDDDQEVKF